MKIIVATSLSSGGFVTSKFKLGLLSMLIFSCAMMLSSSVASAHTSKGELGLGIILANHTGLSGKYVYKNNRDIAAALSWNDNHFHLSIDHLWDSKINLDGDHFDFYYGLGGSLVTYNNYYYHFHNDRYKSHNDLSVYLGIRAPVGIQHFFREAPVQIFFEIAPTLVLKRHFDLDIDLALGVRYFL